MTPNERHVAHHLEYVWECKWWAMTGATRCQAKHPHPSCRWKLTAVPKLSHMGDKVNG